MTFNLDALLGTRATFEGRLLGDCLAGAGDRVFGGQALAQALTAAGTSVDVAAHPPSSIHGHFLSPGDASQPLEYDVVPLKDGRSFVVRRVDVRQSDRVIITATATFHAPEDAPEHQLAAPHAPAPEDCPPFRPEEFGAPSPAYGPVEARLAGHDDAVPSLAVWLRLAADVPDDTLLRAAGVVWLSDLTLTRTVDLPRRHWAGFRQGASLDHTVWFHRPADPGSWLLISQSSESYAGARGLARGQMFDRDGTLRATAVQECMIRRPSRQP